LQAGVCVHGAAADLLVAEGIGPVGMTASELGPAVRRLLNGSAPVVLGGAVRRADSADTV